MALACAPCCRHSADVQDLLAELGLEHKHSQCNPRGRLFSRGVTAPTCAMSEDWNRKTSALSQVALQLRDDSSNNALESWTTFYVNILKRWRHCWLGCL